jgi:nicotinamidase
VYGGDARAELAQAIDARKFQFEVDVVRAGVRAVDPEAEERVLAELERWGCRLV